MCLTVCLTVAAAAGVPRNPGSRRRARGGAVSLRFSGGCLGGLFLLPAAFGAAVSRLSRRELLSSVPLVLLARCLERPHSLRVAFALRLKLV